MIFFTAFQIGNENREKQNTDRAKSVLSISVISKADQSNPNSNPSSNPNSGKKSESIPQPDGLTTSCLADPPTSLPNGFQSKV